MMEARLDESLKKDRKMRPRALANTIFLSALFWAWALQLTFCSAGHAQQATQLCVQTSTSGGALSCVPVTSANPLPTSGGGGGGGGAITAASGSYSSGALSAGSVVDLGTGGSPAANTVNSRLATINTTLGSPFQTGGSIGNTAFVANAGTNLNTSALALETGGNLATLAGVVTSAVAQTNEKQINGVVPLMGNGVTGTGAQRVTIASDNTAFAVNATVQASSNIIGNVRIDQTTLGTTNGFTEVPANAALTNISASTSATPATATQLLAASATHHKVIIRVEGGATVCFSKYTTTPVTTGAAGVFCLAGASTANNGTGGSYTTPVGMTDPNAIYMVSGTASVGVYAEWQ